uniref:Uncharacterized protein n=1 Tax=Trichuris muris TaxID=70415 RepID=A0A5S6R5F6_TRIMR
MKHLCGRLVIATLNCLQAFVASVGGTSCYSCMSYIYGANWEYLDYKELYLRPSAFSDRCTNGSDSKYIGKTPCLHNCILIVEKMRVGARGHDGYIRGCYDQIFRHGFNDSNVIASKLKYRDFCTRTMMSSLIARRDKPPDTEVLVCSCRDTLCNRSARPSPGRFDATDQHEARRQRTTAERQLKTGRNMSLASPTSPLKVYTMAGSAFSCFPFAMLSKRERLVDDWHLPNLHSEICFPRGSIFCLALRLFIGEHTRQRPVLSAFRIVSAVALFVALRRTSGLVFPPKLACCAPYANGRPWVLRFRRQFNESVHTAQTRFRTVCVNFSKQP